MGKIRDKVEAWIMANNLRRWLLFLPLALLAATFATLFLKFVELWFTSLEGAFEWKILDVIFSVIISTIASPVATGSYFVFVGGYIAPKKFISILLLGIVVIFSAYSIYEELILFAETNWWLFAAYIFLMIGGFVGYRWLKSDTKDK